VRKLEAIADDHPELAARLVKLLDEVVAGKDIRPEMSPELAAAMTPEAMKSLKKLWPGGTLTLVKREKGPEGGPQWVSTYRLRKGNDAVLVVFGVDAGGKIAFLARTQDREYE
jgi:hypothetical protein